MKSISQKLIQRSGTDEQYTTRNGVMLILPYLDHLKDKTIGCPFDTEDSQFVKVLKENGYEVVYSHIGNGQDFFEYEPEQWDVILSNPPYKNKRLFIKRCMELGNPGCLLLPLQTLADQTFYNEIEDIENLQTLIPKGRLRFDLQNLLADNRPKSQSTFKSVYFGYKFFNSNNNTLGEIPVHGEYLSMKKRNKNKNRRRK